MQHDQISPSRDRHYRGHRRPKTAAAQEFVNKVLNDLTQSENRVRRRRPDDQRTFEQTVAAVTCEAIHHALSEERTAIAVTRSKAVLETRSRYRAVGMNGRLPAVLDAMQACRLIDLKLGAQRDQDGAAKRTTYRATPKLRKLIEQEQLTFDDLGVAEEELVVLRGVKAHGVDRAPLIEYTDTDVTRRYRREMETINAGIAAADIDYDDHNQSTGKRVDVGERRLVRSFNRGDFGSCGRLFGGGWQNLTKAQRANGLTIDGELVVEADYSSMGPHILYAIAGATPTFRDAYAVPCLEPYRDGIKRVMGATIFNENGRARTRMPDGVRKLFPQHVSYSAVIDGLKTLHPAIAHLFDTNIGHQVMFIESEIMVKVLLSLSDQGIVALPIHDAVLVKPYELAHVMKVMEGVAEEYLSFPIPVRASVKSAGQPLREVCNVVRRAVL